MSQRSDSVSPFSRWGGKSSTRERGKIPKRASRDRFEPFGELTMRSNGEENGTVARDVVGTARPNLPQEDVSYEPHCGRDTKMGQPERESKIPV